MISEVERLKESNAALLAVVTEELPRVTAHRDGLLADVERLQADLAKKTDGYERMWSALQAETATSIRVRGELRAEIKRLQGALEFEEHNQTRLMTTIEDQRVELDRMRVDLNRISVWYQNALADSARIDEKIERLQTELDLRWEQGG